MAETLRAAGTKAEDITGYMNKVTRWPGVFGTITFNPTQHNGYPDEEVIMCAVNSLRDGAFDLAPGYGR